MTVFLDYKVKLFWKMRTKWVWTDLRNVKTRNQVQWVGMPHLSLWTGLMVLQFHSTVWNGYITMTQVNGHILFLRHSQVKSTGLYTVWGHHCQNFESYIWLPISLHNYCLMTHFVWNSLEACLSLHIYYLCAQFIILLWHNCSESWNITTSTVNFLMSSHTLVNKAEIWHMST